MNPMFTCKYNGHENEPIVGFCLDYNCLFKSQYCNQCMIPQHSTHHQKQMIQSFQYKMGEWRYYIEQEFEATQRNYQQTVKLLTDEANHISWLAQYLEDDKFQYIAQNILVFKEIFSIQQTNRDIKSNNFTDVLGRLTNIIRALSHQELISNQSQKEKDEENNQMCAIIIDQGITHSFNGQFTKAITCLDEAIKINYFNPSAHREKGFNLTKLGFALINIQRFQDAIQSLDQAIMFDDKDSVAHYLKGNALQNLKHYEQSIQSYDRAIQLDPQYIDALQNKGQALIKIKQYEAAIKMFDNVIKLNPKMGSCFSSKGFALHFLKRTDEAIQCYNQAIQLDPQIPLNYINLGNILKILGRNEQALQCYNQAIIYDSKCILAYFNKGEILRKLKLFDEAIVCFDQVIELNPKFAKAFESKGKILKHQCRFEEATGCFESAIALEPDNKDAVKKLMELQGLQQTNLLFEFANQFLQENSE